MSGGEIRTARDARRRLGLADCANPDEIRRAFRAAARIAHPDHGGDAEALRQIVDAYRLLTDSGRPRLSLETAQDPAAPLTLTAVQAALGGMATVVLPDGRQGVVTVPPGLRAGDRVRLTTRSGPILFQVRFDRGEMDVRGDDLWMVAKVAPAILAEGGRLSIDTPTGARSVEITVKSGQRRLVRLDGAGLPARGRRPQGDLFIRLKPDMDLAETPTQTLKRRFAADWAA